MLFYIKDVDKLNVKEILSMIEKSAKQELDRIGNNTQNELKLLKYKYSTAIIATPFLNCIAIGCLCSVYLILFIFDLLQCKNFKRCIKLKNRTVYTSKPQSSIPSRRLKDETSDSKALNNNVANFDQKFLSIELNSYKNISKI